jgi:uncharacterized membrane protein (Fun14 family)
MKTQVNLSIELKTEFFYSSKIGVVTVNTKEFFNVPEYILEGAYKLSNHEIKKMKHNLANSSLAKGTSACSNVCDFCTNST